MPKKVEIFYSKYSEGIGERERLKRISEILSEGVYSYLKDSGFLRNDSGGAEKIKELLGTVNKVCTQAEEEEEEIEEKILERES